MIRKNNNDNLDHRLTLVESKVDSIENLQEQTYSLVKSVQDIASTMKRMLEDQKDMKLDIKTLKEEPLNNYKERDKSFKGALYGSFGTLVGGGIIWVLVQYANSLVK